MSDPSRIVIIGAGISGLAAAHRLASLRAAAARPVQLRVLDARDRPGGAVWSIHRDGFLLEGGADSFITTKPDALNLCRELQLDSELLPTDSRYRRSFVLRAGRLLPVPDGFQLMAPSRLLPFLTSPILSTRGKLRALGDLFLPRRTDPADESLAAFARRRFGRETFDRLIQPLVAGIYTADPAELSLDASLPQFREMERNHRSIIRALIASARTNPRQNTGTAGARYGLFLSLRRGMQSLVDRLAQSLPTGSLLLNTQVRRIARPDRLAPWRIELLDGQVLDADAVILATEAHAAARLLEPLDPDLSRHLRAIPYASSAILGVALNRDQIAHPLDGFGLVIPACENRDILAASFSSIKFPDRAPAGKVLIRVFLGGSLQPHIYDLDDQALIATGLRELASLLGISGQPDWVELSRHPRSMPQYILGHRDRVASIRELAANHPGLLLAGNAFDGVGLPDCIRSGRAAAESAWSLLCDPKHGVAA